MAFLRLEAVLLSINSPGGSPAQCELISDHIWSLSKEKKVNLPPSYLPCNALNGGNWLQVPVLSFVEDLAASGGYWLACVGEKIYIAKTSVLGSIGVINYSLGFVELIQKYMS